MIAGTVVFGGGSVEEEEGVDAAGGEVVKETAMVQ